MPSPAMIAILTVLALGLALVALGVYLYVRYAPIVGRIFEETPLFLPLRVAPEPGGEEVRFASIDGLELAGTYYQARTVTRAGVVVFCHEFLSDRWSFLPYVDHLRDRGFDLFTFDFRNHGDSAVEAGYEPLQWVSDREVGDLRAALDYLRTRPDRDPAGFGLFGISRGGSTALCVAAQEPGVWGVVTDGAFPTRGTMLAYTQRWAAIYVSIRSPLLRMADHFFAFVAWAGRVRTERRRGCRYPSVEWAVARLAPRPWLMIHGAKDAYIGPEIAEVLFAEAGEPKELWIVPDAKHNRCLEVAPDVYRDRVADFFGRFGPRRLPPSPDQADARAVPTPEPRAVASPMPR